MPYASLPPTIASWWIRTLLAALQTLAETYRTQASGIIYEKPLDYPLQRALYDYLKAAISEFRKEEAQRQGMTTVRDSEIRDALIFLTQLCAVHVNGRPKGRAYLDLIRQQFPKEEFQTVGFQYRAAVVDSGSQASGSGL